MTNEKLKLCPFWPHRFDHDLYFEVDVDCGAEDWRCWFECGEHRARGPSVPWAPSMEEECKQRAADAWNGRAPAEDEDHDESQ